MRRRAAQARADAGNTLAPRGREIFSSVVGDYDADEAPQSVPPPVRKVSKMTSATARKAWRDRADESRKRSGPRSPSSRSSFTSRPTVNVHAGRRRNYHLVPLCRSTADKETPNRIPRLLIRTYTRSFPRSSSRHVQHRFRRGPAQGRDHHPHLGQSRVLCCLVTRGANLSLSLGNPTPASPSSLSRRHALDREDWHGVAGRILTRALHRTTARPVSTAAASDRDRRLDPPLDRHPDHLQVYRHQCSQG